ncbi:MAG: hypothetical protein GDA67_07555 [Nitrospira sp. CR1.3]|nr:hypothetical protein [Nitrospira sp. CR1.3]
MKKMVAQFGAIVGSVLLTGVTHVLANEPKGEGAPDYSGISYMYYTLIGLVLAYGVYDTFLKKN